MRNRTQLVDLDTSMEEWVPTYGTTLAEHLKRVIEGRLSALKTSKTDPNCAVRMANRARI